MKPLHCTFSLIAAATLAFAGCSGSAPAESGKPPLTQEERQEQTDPVEPGTSMDPVEAAVEGTLNKSVSPCTDFYQYACGGWLQSTELPGDETRWGRGFSVIREQNKETLRTILQDQADSRPGQYYAQCMDEAAVSESGLARLKEKLDAIDTIKNAKGLMQRTADLHLAGADPFFGIWVEGDFKNPDVNIAYLWQGGLGLPDRDDYLKQTEENLALQADYREHVSNMFVLTGTPEPESERLAQAVFDLEMSLAKIALPRNQLRQADKRYNPLTATELKDLAKELPWNAFFQQLGVTSLEKLSVSSTEYFDAMAYTVASAELDTLRAYLKWRLIHTVAPHLTTDLVTEDFAFYGQRLRDQKELKPRWKRCVQLVDRGMGELLGQAYVKEEFAGDSKLVAERMVQDIELAFEEGIEALEWMDDETRAVAMEKLDAIANKIGYPDAWRSYDGLELGDDFFSSLLAVRTHNTRYWLDQVGQPVNRDIWYMSPPTVNAYYNATTNEIVFPAGILQPPFFSAEFPAAMNYGGIGMVVGHEISHGFDDQGRKFDASGTLTDWWTAGVIESFKTRALCVDEQYEDYEVQPNVYLDGELTLGENIADLGGVKYAYRAYLKRRSELDTLPEYGGLNDKQLFFVSFAQSWCTLATAEEEKVRARTDSHSPPRFRVNGALVNLPEFHQAFGCEPGQPMVRDNMCTVW